MEIKKSSRFKTLIEWIVMNPYIKTVMAAIPMIWKPVIVDILDFTNVPITILVFSIIFLFLLITNLYVHRIAVTEKAFSTLANDMSEKAKALYEEKLVKQEKSFISSIKTSEKISIKYDIEDRIKKILKMMVASFNKLINMKDEDVSAMLLYAFNSNHSDWRCFPVNYISNTVFKDANELMTHAESFGRFLFEETTYPFYFLNDKKKGERHKIYAMNKRDIEAYKRTKQYGSIFGLKFCIPNNDGSSDEKYIEAALFISTFGKKIDNSFMGILSENVGKNIEKILLPYFEMNLKTELMYLYEQKMNNASN